LVELTGATAYMPEGSGAEFEHRPLADGEPIELGNTMIEALATPGHARAHHSYLVTDHRRGDQPWFVLTGDSLLVGDIGRPDLHAASDDSVEELARTLYRSLHERLLTLPDHLLVYPAHYAGSVCGRGLSGHPASSIGFERRHNEVLSAGSESEFVEAVLTDMPPAPEHQAEIVAANRGGDPSGVVA
jgi:glyoxylase-like metal-dependent hydrolase (beta-lactamase superfamily II)